MRFFRVPTFTGIEVHRDDMDRGSLRYAENCIVHSSGGLRSGPVWEKIDKVPMVSQGRANYISAIDDCQGNSLIFASRYGETHDIVMQTENQKSFSEACRSYAILADTNLCDNINSDFDSLMSYGDTLETAVEAYNEASISKSSTNDNYFTRGTAYFCDIGNRLLSITDGSKNPILFGKGPVVGKEDNSFYQTQNTEFPYCKYVIRGPKKILVGAGDPENPLTVYVSEPSGESDTIKTGIQSASLSKVDIMASNAKRITGLSTRGENVVVHTDKGCHLLYTPSSDQADSGYRLEQKSATNFSGAVDHQALAGEQGTQTFWLGADGQIYKDESSTTGPEDVKETADPDQASWKSKGLWEKEMPENICKSFSTFEAQTGMYIVFTESL